MRLSFLFVVILFATVGLSGQATSDDGSDVLTNTGSTGTIIFTGGAFVANAGGYIGLGSALEFASFVDSAADQYAAMMDDDALENTGTATSGLDFGG